jgi:hypothetical protein
MTKYSAMEMRRVVYWKCLKTGVYLGINGEVNEWF